MENIAQIREKYPQYSDMSDTAFADAMHSKFYADIPKQDFYVKLGIKSNVDQIPGMAPQQQPQQDRGFTNPFMRALSDVGSAVIETPATLATGAFGGLVGNIAGVGASLLSPERGTPQGAKIGEQTAQRIAEMFTYQPRGQGAKDVLEAAAPFMQNVAAIPIPTLQAAGATAKPLVQALRTYGEAGAQQVANTPAVIAKALRNRQEPPLSGVGAASVGDANLRMARALQLPIPIQLTEGQATRKFAQQRFERETAKDPELGIKLRERATDQNTQILRNFDSFIEQTGADLSGNLRAVGEVVDSALVAKATKAKTEINNAYSKARAAGETKAVVDVSPLDNWLVANEAEAIAVPEINSIKSKLETLKKSTNNQISIDDVENLYQAAGQLSKEGDPSSVFMRQVKTILNDMTEGVGGDLYKNARSLRTKYGKEFENVGVINKLLSTKPGTTDRVVALEDVYRHSIQNGSLDDVRQIRRVLQTAGPNGAKAWKELQGQTIKDIKDAITKNVQRDELGNPVVSPAAMDKMISSLDADGKLDFIFGKNGAENLRAINDTTKNALVAVPNAVNQSNTASVVLAALDTIISGASGLPLPVLSGGRYAMKKYKEKKTANKVAQALSYGEQGNQP